MNGNGKHVNVEDPHIFRGVTVEQIEWIFERRDHVRNRQDLIIMLGVIVVGIVCVLGSMAWRYVSGR